MISAIQPFEQQRLQAMKILSNLHSFINEGAELGVDIHPELARKLEGAVEITAEQKLKVVLLGGFSEGKTSIAAAWLEELDRRNMNISQQESTDEVSVYDFKDQLQIIDTPGLFGFKERANPTTAQIEKYKDITKHYVSEAHLVLYVMNPINPIKESHAEDLNWLFRTLNLLSRTVFVVSRFDEVADITEPDDFKDSYLIKKTSVIDRLTGVLKLAPEEVSELAIVAVSANPFDMGAEHWLSNLPEFRSLSRISELQKATKLKLEANGGLLALAHESQKSIISEVITKQLPVAQEHYALLAKEVQRLSEIERNHSNELKKVQQQITEVQVSLRGSILRYFEDLRLQAKHVDISTIQDYLHREVGDEGSLINQRVQEIFNEEVGSLQSDLTRIHIDVNNEISRFQDIVSMLGKKGINYLSQSGILNSNNILAGRDGLNAATKMVGLDFSKFLKFKPWGATKLASGLGRVAAAAGLLLEAWDSYKTYQREQEFAAMMTTIDDNLKGQSQEALNLVAAPDFSEQFFPVLGELKQQLSDIDEELSILQERETRFRKWQEAGNAIAIEFHNLSTNGEVL